MVWSVKGSGMGDFGGGSPERLRPWLGSQRPGLALGSAELQGAHQARPEEAQGLGWGTMLPRGATTF